MADISSTIKDLAARRAVLAQEIGMLDEAIKSLQKIAGVKAPAVKVKAKAAPAPAAAPKKKQKRNISPEARARIVAAQKRRWAKFHEGTKDEGKKDEAKKAEKKSEG